MGKIVALIDSGIDNNIQNNIQAKIKPISVGIFDNEEDEIGHGTAIASILLNKSEIDSIYSFKIFAKDKDTKFEYLCITLKYILTNLKVDIIHLSMGLIYIEEKEKLVLKEICSKLVIQGTIIVAAFDNMGAISYPAAFEDVIGVYWSKEVLSVREFIYLENSIVNVLGYSGLQRLPWKDGIYKNVAGSSFIAPHITNLIIDFLSKGISGLEDIHKMLKISAKEIRTNQKYDLKQFIGLHSNIKKALLFPINKEIKTLVENIDIASFKLYGLSDIPYSKYIGKKIKDIFLDIDYTNEKILSINSINWNEDFDTVILGHVKQISNLLQRNFTLEILEKCKSYKKNIYSFDELSHYNELVQEIIDQGNSVEYIYLKTNRKDNYIGALYKLPIPVVAVVGTGPKQGKFTLQLSLIKELRKLKYNVGFFGTEPSSALLGADICFPIGYNSGIHLEDLEYTQIANKLIANIKNKDIILVGLQSQILQYGFGNLGFYPFIQERVLIATEPDCVILCINLWDETDYINRCIQYLESYYSSKVLCIVIYPFKKNNEWTLTNGIDISAKTKEIEVYRKKIIDNFKLPVYINRLESKFIVKEIIDFF